MTLAIPIKNLPLQFQIRKSSRVHVFTKAANTGWVKVYTCKTLKQAHAYISKITHYKALNREKNHVEQ